MHILSDEMLISMFDIKVTLFYVPLPRVMRPIQLGIATVSLKMHVFELGQKKLEMHIFTSFLKRYFEIRVFGK